MKDEFEFLERLFFDTYGHIFRSNDVERKAEFLVKDISNDFISEFDKIKSAYFEIAGQGVSKDVVQSMFTFRARRLLNFKLKIEENLKEAVNNLVLPNESNSLICYNNLLAVYEGVVGLLRFMVERLFVSLHETINEESLVLNYRSIDDNKVKEWHKEFKKNYSFEEDYILVDGISIDVRNYSKNFMHGDKTLEIKRQILYRVNGDPLEEDDSFGRLIMHVKEVIHLTRDSKEQEILYQGLSGILSSILRKKDKFERELEALNLLIETNIVPEAITGFTIESIDKTLLDKNEKERYDILIEFKKRFYKLKDSPSYSNCHLSNIKKLSIVTVDELINYVESKLENYDSSLLGNTNSLNSLGKINTNLTVSQISLLFRMLSDEKIIQNKSVPKLSKQIASSFSSKQKDDISFKSIKNNFDSPSNEAIEFWDSKLVRLRQLLKKY